MSLQEVFDASASAANKIEQSVVSDALKTHYMLRVLPKVIAAVPFVSVCVATEKIAKVARRQLDTSKLL